MYLICYLCYDKKIKGNNYNNNNYNVYTFLYDYPNL